jgi:hypothetical protein
MSNDPTRSSKPRIQSADEQAHDIEPILRQLGWKLPLGAIAAVIEAREMMYGLAPETPAVDPLQEALERLASMESFTGSGAIKLPEDAELIARMHFARLQLVDGPPSSNASEPRRRLWTGPGHLEE